MECFITNPVKNLNAIILTEAGLIGSSEYFPLIVWMVMFLEAQGYEIKKNILFQDNQSTIGGNQPILYYTNCPMFGFQSLLSTV